MPKNQANLPGITSGNNRNKGKEFEDHLEALHDFYRLQGLIDVVRNEEKWSAIGKLPTSVPAEYFLGNASKFQIGSYKRGQLTDNSTTLAVLGSGWIIKKERSDVDYSGGNGNIAVIFDAKECGGDYIAMDKLSSHQIVRLLQSRKCRTVAGFMIWFYVANRAFFAPIEFVSKKEMIWITNKMGGRAKAGTASISIKELEEHGIEITRSKLNGSFDWFSILCQPKLI